LQNDFFSQTYLSKTKMKGITLKTVTKNIFFGIFTSVRNYSFLNSSVVPAARGSVKIKRDNNKNYVIQIHLSNLAEVERVQPSKQTYVVWMVTDRDMTKNIGQLNSSVSFFSKRLTDLLIRYLQLNQPKYSLQPKMIQVLKIRICKLYYQPTDFRNNH
jgi:hypothetical protein